MTFDDWMLIKDKSYVPTDDSMQLRLLRECWFSRAAQETAPVGYWLQHVEAIGGDPHRRDVFKKAVPWSLNKTPNALAWGGGHRNASGFTVSFAAATAFEV